jgi:parallel beta-helix repeat protein
MSGNKANFGVFGYELSHFIQNIDTSNLVDGKPIYYWVDRHGGTIPGDAGFVGLVNSKEITVKDLTLTTNNEQGVLLAYTNNSRIENNIIANNINGVYCSNSHFNVIAGNNISDHRSNGYMFGIKGSTCTNSIIKGNRITMNNRWGYGISNCKYSTISDNIISMNTGEYGYAAKGSDHSNFTNNKIIMNAGTYAYGPYGDYSNYVNNNITMNTGEYGYAAEGSDHSNFTNNKIIMNAGTYAHGPYGDYSNYVNNNITMNTGEYGYAAKGSDHSNFNNNKIIMNAGTYAYGFCGDCSNFINNTITINTTTYGYGICGGSNSNISNNTVFGIYNNTYGIYISYSSNSTITNNNVSNNWYGIFLRSSSSNNLTNNTVSNNNCSGICLTSSSDNIIMNNTVKSNKEVGIGLDSSSNNTIYNNFFNNTNNAYDNGNNIWNITKTNGTNIIGGPYLGGNCWSDYKGNDTDGDGLGDTLLPYNSSGNITHGGDYHPLIMGIDISVSDIAAKVLVDGENATINATVHTNASFNVSNVTVQLLVNNKSIQNITVEIPQNSSTNVTFDGWNVSWSVKDTKRQPINITVVVDPDNEISDTNKTNNTVTREFPLCKGEKKADADGRGFIADSTKSAVYAVPIAIWFDDDAFKFTFLGVTWVGGVPTRHYNPIAMDVAVLNDIETDFNYTQFPNGSVSLSISNFTSDAERTFTTFWKNSSGIVIVNDTRKSAIVGAPIASYLNWPMAPSSLIKNKTVAQNLIAELNITYVLVIADDKSAVKSIINDTKNLDLEENQTLFVKGYAVEPLDNLEPTDLFNEVLDAFGDRSSSIVVTNSRSNSSVASAPLAAFYKSMILDVREVVTKPVDYTPDTFAGLNPINEQVEDIVWRAGKHNILDFTGRYMPAKTSKTLYLVGDTKSVPFGIEEDPLDAAGIAEDCNPNIAGEQDADSDWTATDSSYYVVKNTIPGGRMPLEGKDNLNYIARALQFDELPVGERDVGDGWEDNIMGVGIYNPDGKHHWAKNDVWWLDSVVYQVRDLSNKTQGMEITRLFECAGRHNGSWGKNWYRLDNQQRKLIKKAPLYWDTHPLTPPENPTGSGNRGDNVNNDNDRVGSENNNGRLPYERIIDNNNNNKYDPGIDVILDDGLVAGIGSNWFWTPEKCKGTYAYSLTVDEEVWDGFDNDGDGTIDEDCSYWRLLEVQEVYNEFLTKQDPDIDPGDWIDLIDANLINELDDKGIIIYSGHSWTDHWAISNIGGADTWDTRTPDEVTLSHYEVLDMAPSLVIASSCGSSRSWEANCIAEEFLKNGALAYIGSTSLAYGSSDEFRQQMFNQITGGRLHIGRAFKSAVDDLDQNDLWAKRFNEGNIFANKTRYEFNLFGLGSTEIDPGEGEERVAYGTPVYDNETKTWSMNITFDIPEPLEMKGAGGNVTEVVFKPDLLKWLSDDASYPALYLLPFDYELPVGGNFSNSSLVNTTVYKVYNFSQYKLKDYGKWPEEIVPLNVSLNETLEEETELYNGTLFPDVLFVNGSEHDSLANRDHVFGSVTAWQVDGTINKTTVYDEIVLKLTYTAPVGIEETHVVDGNDLTVYAAIVSTDGQTHLVKPSLRIETEGGIFYKEVFAENITVGETPQTVTFEVSDIELPKYVGRVSVTEEGKCVAETSFTVMPPKIVINEVYPYPSVVQDAKEEWIEIYNAGELEVNLTGWRIIDGDGDLNYTIPANDSDWDGVLESGSYLVFHVGGTLDTPAEDIYGNFISGVLNDSNDSVSLLSANGTGKDFVRYGDCTDEPPNGTSWTGTNPDAPVQGQSLGRDKDSTDTNDGNDWENTGGVDVDAPTPGLRNYREVTPNQPPIANFTFTPAHPAVGQTIVFNASNSTDPDGFITNYEWDFGDGTHGEGITVSHSYSTAGSYTVNLTITDNEGVKNSSTASFHVVNPIGGMSVAILPKIKNATAGAPCKFTIRIRNTQNFDELVSINVTNSSIPPEYQADLAWFNWTYYSYLYISSHEYRDLGLRLDIPAGVLGYKSFGVIAHGTFGDSIDYGAANVSGG